MRRLNLNVWSYCTLAMLVLLAATLMSGFSTISGANVRTQASFVDEFFIGPLRILLPIIPTFLFALPFSALVRNHFIPATRTRTDIRRYLTSRIVGLSVFCFVIFFIYGVITTIVAYWIAPSVYPDAINPAGYGLSANQALRSEADSSPLVTVLIAAGPIPYFAVAGLWLAAHATALGLVAALAALLVQPAFLAWLVPIGLYLAQSVVLQFVPNGAAASYLISAVYPSGVSEYPLWQALVALGALLALGIGTAATIILRAPKLERFS